MKHPREVAIEPAAVLAQLERILASETLKGSDQLKRLLRITVERTLNGHPELLKEYNIGLEVFQRPPDYDPKVDPIVRVQARRLRAKLDEYYAGEGAADEIVIHIPKGAYVPAFEARQSISTPPVAATTGRASPSTCGYCGGRSRRTRAGSLGGTYGSSLNQRC